MSYACSEYEQLSRRGFLLRSAAVAAAASGPVWLPKIAFAQGAKARRDVLVSIYLRGGADGLTLCVPYADDHYYTARPTIAVPRPDSTSANKAIALNDRFGLPPGMNAMLEPYQAGHLLFVHAVGMPNWSRSHFDAQHWMELGTRDYPSLTTGWLARHLQSVGPMRGNAILRGVSMTYGMRQTLSGAPLTLPVPEPENFGYSGWWWYEQELVSKIHGAYARMEDPVRAAAAGTQETIALLDAIDFAGYVPGGSVVYPDNAFGKSMKAAAALIRADIGIEAIHVDLDGWDTHSEQGSADGFMNQLMVQLSGGLHSFWKDLTSVGRSNWTLAAISEFGRNVRQNASAGTDHGFGNAMMLLGPSVIGGRILTNWPGLHPDQLFEGADLAATIDIRDVLAEVLELRVENKALDRVFPGYRPKFRGVVRPRQTGRTKT